MTGTLFSAPEKLRTNLGKMGVSRGSFAHFPGGGPEGETCKTCPWFDWVTERDKRFNGAGYCVKWFEMKGGPARKKANQISSKNLACKYWGTE